MFSARRSLQFAATAAAIAVGVFGAWRASRPSANQLAIAARKALSRGQSEEARHLAFRALSRDPQSVAARLAAAEVELDSNHRHEALTHLEQIHDDGGSAALMAIGNAGDLLYQMSRMTEAERRYRRVLTIDPQNRMARQRLALLMALAGKRSDAERFYLEIIKSGQFDTHELALLGDPEQVYENSEFIAYFAEPLSDDLWLIQGAARYSQYRNETAKALTLYRKLIDERSNDLDLQAGFGRALVDAGLDDEFMKWHASLPVAAEEHAEIWEVRGRFAQKRNERDSAVRCYLEAIRRDPNLRHAHYQLTVLLHQLGDEERSRMIQQRAEQLKALSETLTLLHLDASRVDLLQRAGELSAALDRPWETWGWLQATAARTGRQDLRVQADRLLRTFDANTPQVLPSGNLAASFDLSVFPLPRWSESSAPSIEKMAATNSRLIGRIKFKDEAQEAGLKFTYFNGRDKNVPGMRIWQSSGGGVAAFDFDGDAWPDLYFTQGCEWPPKPGQTKHIDRLFRNLVGERFADVTEMSRLGDDRFSQGVTVGDFDADGFPDLYVANIGVNRLYRNCGDGTFIDCSRECGLTREGWSTSCLMADLNGDALPEIYDVTYLAGREPLEQICHDKQHNNAPRICSPAVFAAEPDRLFLNRGDGTVEDISLLSGIDVPNGKGLGIVAGDLDGSRRLSLYVANDTTANFLFINRTAHPTDVPTFVEQAITSGCALDSEGRAQASMGIAVDDADGDGRLDLFVTSFRNEYSVLYRQQPGGIFSDDSNSARLKEASHDMLGFGTQFLDADLDGWPDLVVSNGHVDDFSAHGIPFRMRPQFFANIGSAQFIELSANQLGDYFRREVLGRSLVRLDWNRDGREDFVVSHLDTPAALVTNQTSETGHFVTVQLRGVDSNRDAIGAVVQISTGGRTVWKQLTAGDGYQACNQRQLTFGMAGGNLVEELTVHWPSGRHQTFGSVSADTGYLLVEGGDAPIPFPGP